MDAGDVPVQTAEEGGSSTVFALCAITAEVYAIFGGYIIVNALQLFRLYIGSACSRIKINRVGPFAPFSVHKEEQFIFNDRAAKVSAEDLVAEIAVFVMQGVWRFTRSEERRVGKEC